MLPESQVLISEISDDTLLAKSRSRAFLEAIPDPALWRLPCCATSIDTKPAASKKQARRRMHEAESVEHMS